LTSAARRAWRAGPALASALLLLAACGGGSARTLPACFHKQGLSEKPAIPLPRHSVVYGRRSEAGFTVWSLAVPGSLDGVREVFRDGLERAGYRITGGEVEEADAEAEFEGSALTGRLKLSAVDGCAGAVKALVALRLRD
jgi:hypothetical protein